jgi:hypothetical protein
VEEKMRRVISMPVAIIAALVMLASFDSATRSDEQAQPFIAILTSCPV